MDACRDGLLLGMADLLDAEARLRRFAPLLSELFGELGRAGGRIESDLRPAGALARRLCARRGAEGACEKPDRSRPHGAVPHATSQGEA